MPVLFFQALNIVPNAQKLICSIEGNVLPVFQSRGVNGTVFHSLIPRLGTSEGQDSPLSGMVWLVG